VLLEIDQQLRAQPSTRLLLSLKGEVSGAETSDEALASYLGWLTQGSRRQTKFHRETEYLTKDKLPSAWLFTRDDGKPWAHSDWDKLVRAAAAKASLQSGVSLCTPA
jgi:hypothetical protein